MSARNADLEIVITEDVMDAIGKVIAENILRNNDVDKIKYVINGNETVDYMYYALHDNINNGDFYAMLDATEDYLHDALD